jgi:hypothetical protein
MHARGGDRPSSTDLERRSTTSAEPPISRVHSMRATSRRTVRSRRLVQVAGTTASLAGQASLEETLRASCSSDARAAESSGNDSKGRVRRIDQLVESLGLRVFDIQGQPDHQPARRAVQAFRERPREARYPNVFVDGTIVSNSLNGS